MHPRLLVVGRWPLQDASHRLRGRLEPLEPLKPTARSPFPRNQMGATGGGVSQTRRNASPSIRRSRLRPAPGSGPYDRSSAPGRGPRPFLDRTADQENGGRLLGWTLDPFRDPSGCSTTDRYAPSQQKPITHMATSGRDCTGSGRSDRRCAPFALRRHLEISEILSGFFRKLCPVGTAPDRAGSQGGACAGSPHQRAN
jgi:hypothetical protein